MPIEVGIWRLGDKVERLNFSAISSEERLEDILANDISILDPSLLIIGRQVPTSFGKFIDLLAIDSDGKLIVIELKRNKTPREIVAQLLDYGSWVRNLQDEDIADIYDTYQKKYHPQSPLSSLNDTFCKRYGVKDMPEPLNDGHELLAVASELDESTERIINYLSDEYGAAINVAFFRFFKDGNNEYLSRVWFIDPGEAEIKVIEKRGTGPWNFEFYVSFGEEKDRRWEDARRYGFIAAGGGAWYSRTLDILGVGGRIWVNVPGQGYVGVGIVLEKAKPITEFMISDANGKKAPITQVLQNMPSPDKPEDMLEYYVAVKWIKTVSIKDAVREVGFFGNQNSAARPRAPRWNHTVERLKQRWGINE
jgi:hypothetical protein